MPFYLYGFVRKGTRLPSDIDAVGDAGTELRLIESGSVAAVGSDITDERVRGTRKNLIAHARVLESLALDEVVLPLRFGVIVDDDERAREDILEPLRQRLEGLLREFDGFVEVNLKGMYEQDVVLKEVVATNPEIRRLRESTRDLPEEATYYDRIRLGELVAQGLDAGRGRDAHAIVSRLASLARDHAAGSAESEQMVVSESFLVARSDLDKFDRAVEEIGRDYEGRITFKYIGPLPPYSFVDMSLPLEGDRGPL